MAFSIILSFQHILHLFLVIEICTHIILLGPILLRWSFIWAGVALRWDLYCSSYRISLSYCGYDMHTYVFTQKQNCAVAVSFYD